MAGRCISAAAIFDPMRTFPAPGKMPPPIAFAEGNFHALTGAKRS
jgi:hypothetical protein